MRVFAAIFTALAAEQAEQSPLILDPNPTEAQDTTANLRNMDSHNAALASPKMGWPPSSMPFATVQDGRWSYR